MDPSQVKTLLIPLLLFLYLVFSLKPFLNIELLNIYSLELSILLLGSIITLLAISKDKTENTYNFKKYTSIIILFIIIIFGTVLRIRGVKEVSFYNDEYQVVNAAAGYRYTGTFLSWNFLLDKPDSIQSCPQLDKSCNYYTRAFPHTILIAWCFRFLGISELSARLPSLIFGILLIPLSFFVAKYFTKRDDVSLLFSFFISISTGFITLSKYTRMYAIVIPISLLSIYFIYRGLFDNPKKEFRNKFIEKFLSYRYAHLIIGILLFYLAYLLHINVVAIIPAFFLYTIYKYLSSKNKKYLPIVLAGFLFIIITLLHLKTPLSIPIINKILRWVSLLKRNNPVYATHMLGYPFPTLISIPILLSSLCFIKKEKLKETKDHFVFLLISTITIIISFVYIADRYPKFFYISMFVPLGILLVIWMFFLINEKIFSYIKKSSLFIILLILSLSFRTSIYEKFFIFKPISFIDYRTAYSIINENIEPEKDIILGQYLRYYYLDSDIIKGKQIYSLGSDKQQDMEEFLEIVNNAQSGYITWAHNKTQHIRPEIRQYCCDNFEHLSGHSCDDFINDTKIEIFYFSND